MKQVINLKRSIYWWSLKGNYCLFIKFNAVMTTIAPNNN